MKRQENVKKHRSPEVFFVSDVAGVGAQAVRPKGATPTRGQRPMRRALLGAPPPLVRHGVGANAGVPHSAATTPRTESHARDPATLACYQRFAGHGEIGVRGPVVPFVASGWWAQNPDGWS